MKENDPEKWEMTKESNRQYSKVYRAGLTPDKKEHQNALAALRMKAYRQRLKEQQKGQKTRAQIEKQRAKWRQEKADQAAKKTPQRKRRDKEKRRQRYKENKEKALSAVAPASSTSSISPTESPDDPATSSISPTESPDDPASSSITPTKSPDAPSSMTSAARRKALSRARAVLPKSPRRYQRIVQDLQDKATPRKKALFAASAVSKEAAAVGEQVTQRIAELKSLRTKEANAERMFLLNAAASAKNIGSSVRAQAKATGVHRKTLKKLKALKAAVSIKKEIREKITRRKLDKEIQEFMEIAATTLPSKKAISKKTGIATSVLRLPLADLHKQFNEETGKSVSIAHFARCRPKHVKVAQRNFLRQCLCEYCENCKLKIQVINGKAARCRNCCRIRHVYHAVDLVTCGRKDGKWGYACAARQCDTCKEAKHLDDHLQPLPNDNVKWKRWENKQFNKNGKTVSLKVLVQKEGTLADLKAELKRELIFLAGHLYQADWQYQQFNTLRHLSPFPQGTALMVLDFAENFTCSFQDEVQAAHWHHEQVTVHPIVTYHQCLSCQETVTESLVFVSPDRNHDFHAVHHYTIQAIQHLRHVLGLQLDSVVQFTDGCAAQYKSRGHSPTLPVGSMTTRSPLSAISSAPGMGRGHLMERVPWSRVVRQEQSRGVASPFPTLRNFLTSCNRRL